MSRKIERIIIEGPDCSGKSLLVERLKNKLRWDAKSLHHLEGDQFERYLQEYALNRKIVFDRSHFSEIIYSLLWRGGSPFSSEEREILDRICQQRMIVIFANPSLEVLRERYRTRAYIQPITEEELAKAQQMFEELFQHQPHWPYRSENFTELNLLIEKVLSLL